MKKYLITYHDGKTQEVVAGYFELVNDYLFFQIRETLTTRCIFILNMTTVRTVIELVS